MMTITATVVPDVFQQVAVPQIESLAQLAVTRILNSLPEGLLIAVFAWAMLRILPRQNSGTRFAVWFVALLAVVALPFTGGGVFDNLTHFLSTTAASQSVSDHALLNLPGHWGLVLFSLWILASCAAIFRLGHGLWHLRSLRRSCVEIDSASLSPETVNVIADFSSARAVMLATSSEISVPAAIGFFRPMIVIPDWALAELAPEELRVVLLHELAHLRRWDDWTNLLQKIVRAVFFFHPAVLWIEKRLSLEREMACDDHVLAETANPRGYAKCLIALLERSFARRGWAMAQAAVHRAHEATQRLSQILDTSRSNSKQIWKPALALVGVFSFGCLVIVPHAPRLVGFVPSAHPIHSNGQQYAFQNPALNPAVVIPAAFHTDASPAQDQSKSLSAEVVHPAKARPANPHWAIAHAKQRAVVTPQAVAATVATPAPIEVLALSADGNQAPAATMALFVLRTTERIGPDSYMWSIHVWQVTFVPDAKTKLPPAKKT
jgi:beta-lactamase regulating signal transducer with metallopeptidase domain